MAPSITDRGIICGAARCCQIQGLCANKMAPVFRCGPNDAGGAPSGYRKNIPQSRGEMDTRAAICVNAAIYAPWTGWSERAEYSPVLSRHDLWICNESFYILLSGYLAWASEGGTGGRVAAVKKLGRERPPDSRMKWPKSGVLDGRFVPLEFVPDDSSLWNFRWTSMEDDRSVYSNTSL